MRAPRLEWLRANWDEKFLLPIHINHRPDGTKAVLRGQHRVLTAIAKINAGELPKSYKLLGHPLRFATMEEEKDYIIRSEQGEGMGKWGFNDYWLSRLVVDPKARLLDEKVKSMGYQIVTSTSTDTRRQLKCISKLEKIMDHADGLLDLTLKLIREAWLDEPGSHDGVTVMGAAMFIYTHAGHAAWSFDQAIERMRLGGIKQVRIYAKRSAVDVRGPDAQFCTGMRDLYNDYCEKGARRLRAERPWSKPKTKVSA